MGALAAVSASRTPNRPDGSGIADDVAGKLQALEQMDPAALRAEWRRLYRAHPPKRVARDLLLLAVAWKIQEQAHGGLGVATRRRVADLAATLERDGDVTRNRVARLKPGARLVREWRGETHTVIVLEDGFEWRGRQWRSLSVIARAITGGHWSGPRFFGLTERARPDTQDAVAETGDA
jgi:hypothetical protein